MPWRSDQQRKWGHTLEGEKALGGKEAVGEWDKATKAKRVGKKKRKKKTKISVNNKLKGALGQMDPETNKIEINVKKHKGDRAELASTIKHELMHVARPNATEKEVYKATRKTKIPFHEQNRLLAKLKKKYKKPGEMIAEMNRRKKLIK